MIGCLRALEAVSHQKHGFAVVGFAKPGIGDMPDLDLPRGLRIAKAVGELEMSGQRRRVLWRQKQEGLPEPSPLAVM